MVPNNYITATASSGDAQEEGGGGGFSQTLVFDKRHSSKQCTTNCLYHIAGPNPVCEMIMFVTAC